jgi:hypothetical protein
MLYSEIRTITLVICTASSEEEPNETENKGELGLDELDSLCPTGQWEATVVFTRRDGLLVDSVSILPTVRSSAPKYFIVDIVSQQNELYPFSPR